VFFHIHILIMDEVFMLGNWHTAEYETFNFFAAEVF
jgi:hypothetical protein